MSKKEFNYEAWSRKLLLDFCRDYDPNSKIAKLAKEQVDKYDKRDRIDETTDGTPTGSVR